MTRLSKSKLMSANQCAKRLYLEVYQPELAEYSQATQKTFDRGTMVGELACNNFPGGVNIDTHPSLTAKLAATAEIIATKARSPLYEATFEHDNVLIKADIINPYRDGYDLYEVKSSTSIKAPYYLDAAIQTHVISQAGYPLKKTYLTHLNNQFVYTSIGNYDGLFIHNDITTEIKLLQPTVQTLINEAKRILDGNCPDIAAGDHCSQPYECPFIDHCSPADHTQYPVTSLPRGKREAETLIAENITDISEIPAGRLQNTLHERIRLSVVSGKPYIDPEVQIELNNLPYPRYYIDFETIDFAVPIWLHTRPYQQLPFQWSCHIQYSDGTLEHKSFLDVSGDAPMQGFIDSLLQVIGNTGPVIVYNKGFESRIMNDAARLFSKHAAKIHGIIDRMYDLLVTTRKYYYHPDMHGSWSLKAVLPTIVPELKYDDLEDVQHGGDAQDAYMESIHPDTAPERKAQLVNGLEKYCELDTLAMVEIVNKLS